MLEDAVTQIMTVWTGLSLQKKLIAAVATLGMFATVLMLGRLATTPSMSLLYAGLESGSAGEIVRVLEQGGTPYEIRGDSIFVPSTARDELRLTLASEGLPANSTKGYELLDSLTGFGTTSQMFDAAYWRAKEGELARTILSNPSISSVRVHIANTQSNPFQRESGATASVFVTSVNGALPSQQAKALKFLVASAVPGLVPDDVAVIDSVSGLVSGSEEKVVGNTGDEKSLALKERVTRLVEARVGRGNAVVEVSVDTVTETESVRERLVDPESRVAISTDTEERSNTSQEAGGGDVTVASNLPNGDAGGGGESNSQNSETRERVNYEVSETEREIIREPGAIKRLTVAVLVNGQTQIQDDGSEAFVPVAEEDLNALRDLVASAVGFEEARGDVITIKSMPFQPVEEAGATATADFWSGIPLDPVSLIQMAVLAIVSLILGLFVVRPILSSPEQDQVLALPGAPSDMPETGFETPDNEPTAVLTGEIDDGTGEFAPLPTFDSATDFDAAGGFTGDESPDPVERLRNAISDRREETVEILRGWLDETEEKA
ncbi:flagellar basal-body MS-ring/collar protein FliF [Primorskyibacter aestuariivivens]|uniref:flagellar basal-body MS-ring/collar protein FliF n=1 Tax=Primorskyibacter aestuariivivens TaxID=1888912 RepID=UPI002301D1F5|nr:flagellar basal-body MS-ring/collar protein FliF [Primorskyibacter aestuariivivens]MDA7430267.1 flagellar basal-body MS-ring/collar protein FliF [Primorskyibacter aestuariivivens]